MLSEVPIHAQAIGLLYLLWTYVRNLLFLFLLHRAEYHLGYSSEEICQKSWYSMLHPEDIHEAREKHVLCK